MLFIKYCLKLLVLGFIFQSTLAWSVISKRLLEVTNNATNKIDKYYIYYDNDARLGAGEDSVPNSYIIAVDDDDAGADGHVISDNICKLLNIENSDDQELVPGNNREMEDKISNIFRLHNVIIKQISIYGIPDGLMPLDSICSEIDVNVNELLATMVAGEGYRFVATITNINDDPELSMLSGFFMGEISYVLYESSSISGEDENKLNELKQKQKQKQRKEVEAEPRQVDNNDFGGAEENKETDKVVGEINGATIICEEDQKEIYVALSHRGNEDAGRDEEKAVDSKKEIDMKLTEEISS